MARSFRYPNDFGDVSFSGRPARGVIGELWSPLVAGGTPAPLAPGAAIVLGDYDGGSGLKITQGWAGIAVQEGGGSGAVEPWRAIFTSGETYKLASWTVGYRSGSAKIDTLYLGLYADPSAGSEAMVFMWDVTKYTWDVVAMTSTGASGSGISAKPLLPLNYSPDEGLVLLDNNSKAVVSPAGIPGTAVRLDLSTTYPNLTWVWGGPASPSMAAANYTAWGLLVDPDGFAVRLLQIYHTTTGSALDWVQSYAMLVNGTAVVPTVQAVHYETHTGKYLVVLFGSDAGTDQIDIIEYVVGTGWVLRRRYTNPAATEGFSGLYGMSYFQDASANDHVLFFGDNGKVVSWKIAGDVWTTHSVLDPSQPAPRGGVLWQSKVWFGTGGLPSDPTNQKFPRIYSVASGSAVDAATALAAKTEEKSLDAPSTNDGLGNVWVLSTGSTPYNQAPHFFIFVEGQQGSAPFMGYVNEFDWDYINAAPQAVTLAGGNVVFQRLAVTQNPLVPQDAVNLGYLQSNYVANEHIGKIKLADNDPAYDFVARKLEAEHDSSVRLFYHDTSGTLRIGTVGLNPAMFSPQIRAGYLPGEKAMPIGSLESWSVTSCKGAVGHLGGIYYTANNIVYYARPITSSIATGDLWSEYVVADALTVVNQGTGELVVAAKSATANRVCCKVIKPSTGEFFDLRSTVGITAPMAVSIHPGTVGGIQIFDRSNSTLYQFDITNITEKLYYAEPAPVDTYTPSATIDLSGTIAPANLPSAASAEVRTHYNTDPNDYWATWVTIPIPATGYLLSLRAHDTYSLVPTTSWAASGSPVVSVDFGPYLTGNWWVLCADGTILHVDSITTTPPTIRKAVTGVISGTAKRICWGGEDIVFVLYDAVGDETDMRLAVVDTTNDTIIREYTLGSMVGLEQPFNMLYNGLDVYLFASSKVYRVITREWLNYLIFGKVPEHSHDLSGLLPYPPDTGPTPNTLALRDASGNLEAAAFYATSTKEAKTGIRTWAGDALKLISHLRLVRYFLKSDNEKTPRVGFLAEDAPPLLSGKRKRHMLVTNVVGLLLRAIQQLDDRLRKLEERVHG